MQEAFTQNHRRQSEALSSKYTYLEMAEFLYLAMFSVLDLNLWL